MAANNDEQAETRNWITALYILLSIARAELVHVQGRQDVDGQVQRGHRERQEICALLRQALPASDREREVLPA